MIYCTRTCARPNRPSPTPTTARPSIVPALALTDCVHSDTSQTLQRSPRSPRLSRRTHLHCPAAWARTAFPVTTHRQRQRDLVPNRSNEIGSIPHCIGTSHLLSVTTQGTLSVLYLDFADLTEQWCCTHADAALRRFLQTASHSAARFARANTHATIGLKSSTHVQ